VGLLKILAFSAMTGVSFAFAYATSGDPSQIGAGFAILNSMSQNLDPSIQSVIMVASAALSIYFVFSLAKFFREVYDNKLYGIGVAALGFFGSLLIVLVPQYSTMLVLGVASWLVGIILAMYKNKIKS